MSFLTLIGVEFKKIRRSKILFILAVAAVILWIPSILNAKRREFRRKTISLFRALWEWRGLCFLQVW